MGPHWRAPRPFTRHFCQAGELSGRMTVTGTGEPRSYVLGMSRPPLPCGTCGRIDFPTPGQGGSAHAPGFVTSTAVSRSHTRAGTEAEARKRLLQALVERARFPDCGRAAGTRISATRVWLADLGASQLATSSRQLYRAAARHYLVPTTGDGAGVDRMGRGFGHLASAVRIDSMLPRHAG